MAGQATITALILVGLLVTSRIINCAAQPAASSHHGSKQDIEQRVSDVFEPDVQQEDQDSRGVPSQDREAYRALREAQILQVSAATFDVWHCNAARIAARVHKLKSCQIEAQNYVHLDS